MLFPLLIIILSIAFVSLFRSDQTTVYNATVYKLSDDWHTSDDRVYSLDSLPKGDITLTHSLKGINLSRMRLCFETTDTHVSAYFDGSLLYDYAPSPASIIGRSYGRYIHLIPIPPSAENVTLKLHPVYSGESALLRNTAVEDAGVFIADIYYNGLPKFILCIIIMLFGVLMIIIGFADKITNDSAINFFSLGVFAILSGVWSANDTMILQVYTQHPEIISFMRYVCLMFIVYLPVSFMASSTDHRKTILLPILLILTMINFVLTLTLSVLRISDMHLMLHFSHVNIVIALIMTIYLMIRGIRNKKLDKGFVYTVIIAIDKERAMVMEKMAYTDSVTGLANRAAFHERENEIRRTKSGCIVIQLDINYLKTVNDKHGHAEGDRHITKAAHIIQECFNDIGTSYRTSGDEFILIANGNVITAVENALDKIDEYAKQ